MLKFVATFLLVVLLHSSEAKPTTGNDDLIAVAVIFRHGDRTIIDTYPNDPYINYTWPVGLGQLTNQGKQRVKKFGYWFKQRYPSIIKPDLNHVSLTSTNTSRTQHSLQIFLEQLYGNHTDKLPTTKIVPVDEDCPKYKKLYAQYSKNIFDNFTEDFKDTVQYCAQHTGKPVTTLNFFESLHGVLENEHEEHNLKLPEWTKLVYPEKTKILSGISFASHCGTTDLARLLMGPYFHFLLENFQSEQGYKLMIFSGHDVTISNILTSLGKFDNIPPPYVSSVIFELRRNSTGQKYINIYYKVHDDLQPITLDNCVFDCPLETLKELLKHITVGPQEWKNECITTIKT